MSLYLSANKNYMQKIYIKELTINNLQEILPLISQLNPTMDPETTKERLLMMFDISTYNCFGFYKDDTIVGISSSWLTVRMYSGKQLEIDNVIVDSNYQSQGLGKQFIALIEEWAKKNGCNSVELNAYLTNTRGHKFYHNQGYGILGFHYQKLIK